MGVNLIKIIFGLKAFFIVFTGLLINCCEQYLPIAVIKIFRYGKFGSQIKLNYFDKLQVPKSYFKHFYMFAGPLSSVALSLLYYRYFLNNKLQTPVVWVLNFFLNQPVQSLVPPENVILAMIIFTIHCWKRFYETQYINVFSDVYMNFSIYLVGLSHYFGATISIIGESMNVTKDININLNWVRLTTLDYACAAIFFISTYMQYRTNIILSNLRKDQTGTVITTRYKIPHGELFNYISAPLQFTEIILYICLSVILRKASTFHFITIWTITNQMECAYLSHEWSLKTFHNYPKSRKIIVPFIL